MQLGFLHYSLIRGPFFFQSKGSNQLLVSKTLFIRSVFFFLNTSYPFLKTIDFLHPKSRSLQNFYKIFDDSSFRSNGFFLLLD